MLNGFLQFLSISTAVHNRNNVVDIMVPYQPQQPAQQQPAHQQQMPALRLPSLDRDVTNNGGTNVHVKENKCYKVSVSFDR